MSETKEPRVKIENLPEPEKELTTDEVKTVQGGAWPQKVEIGALKAGASEVLMEVKDSKKP
jgi:hypothetical protein